MNKKNKGLLFVCLFALFWAVEIILIRYALMTGAHPLRFLFHISFCSFLLLGAYNLIRKNDFRKAKDDIGKIILMSLFGGALANVLTFIGLKFSTAVNYGFLIKTTLVFTTLFACLFLKERLTKEKMLFMAILLIGVYLVTTRGVLIVPKIGDLLILAAAVFFSAHAVIAKSVMKKVPAEITVNMRVFFASLFLFPFVFLTGKSPFHFEHPHLIIVVAFIMTIGIILLYKTLEITTASYMTFMNSITPIIVVILALIFLKESISLCQTIGGSLIIISAVLIHRSDV
ncbi:DMT family transporter [Candidatus Woesearchaeota archaeon]|nr:DMT family transporter [Candidatus Woesearchaeota archaeon]